VHWDADPSALQGKLQQTKVNGLKKSCQNATSQKAVFPTFCCSGLKFY